MRLFVFDSFSQLELLNAISFSPILLQKSTMLRIKLKVQYGIRNMVDGWYFDVPLNLKSDMM